MDCELRSLELGNRVIANPSRRSCANGGAECAYIIHAGMMTVSRLMADRSGLVQITAPETHGSVALSMPPFRVLCVSSLGVTAMLVAHGLRSLFIHLTLA